MMEQKLGVNPWLSMWVSPRKTIRALVDYNTSFRFVVLCAIYGFQYMLQTSQFLALGQSTSLIAILLVALVLAIPVGYLVFNVLSFFYFFLGKLLKGKGTFKQVRAATYWSSVPVIVTVSLWILLMLVHGGSVFVPGYEQHLVGMALGINVGAGALQIVVGIWGIVIFLHALGEVQGFSAWMALLNMFLAALTLFIFLFLVGWGISALTHVT